MSGGLQTFPQDVRNEDGILPSVVEVRCLDEDKMPTRWAEIKSRGVLPQQRRTVVEVLRAGGAELSAAVRYHLERRGDLFWMPHNVIILGQWINKYSEAIERQRAQGWQPEPYSWESICAERSK